MNRSIKELYKLNIKKDRKLRGIDIAWWDWMGSIAYCLNYPYVDVVYKKEQR